MDLPNEQNPRPLPQATGAVPGPMQKWIGLTVVGSVLIFAVIGWTISRWNGPSANSVMGSRQGKKQTQSVEQKGGRQLDEERERAYEEGRRKAAHESRDHNQQPSSNRQTGSSQPVPAVLTPQQEYAKLLHDAAMTDNMVEGRKYDERHAPAVAGYSGVPVAATAAVSPVVANNVQTSSKSVQPLAENVLPEGTGIACTLVNQLGGDNTGPVKVQVENDIPFPRIDAIAIPQGSLFLGEAQKVSAQFQQRLAVSFHVLQLGATAGHIRQISLDKFPGLDIEGEAALRDQVNNHYLSIFGASLAIGAIGGLAQIGNSSYGGYGGIDSGTQVRNGISQSMAQSATQILQHFLNQPPTLRIRPGHLVIVHLTANLEILP